MESLEHNGVIVLEAPEPQGISLLIRGKSVILNRLQEQMAIAWARKQGTPYVEDPIFIKNFLIDFSRALGIKPNLELEEIDFAPVIQLVEENRASKEAMTKEEKKAAREARKIQREALKEKYGRAIVDDERMELGNYQTEPSGIFMGRGEHPLRGKWKQGATYKDITLNLSPDAPIPEGDWGEIMWAPDSMWIAKWTDDLTGKTKYVWLHDSTPIKQEREAAKFDKALKMEKKTDAIRVHILKGLHSNKPKQRMVAAACYLIDRLSLRVGDEKDPDEADTVGATTLRVEHLTFKKNSVVFDFLGKDSVAWHKELEMDPAVFDVFRELYENAVERLNSFNQRKDKKTSADPRRLAQIFPSIGSVQVNRFLGQVDPGLTAKVFRTMHASVAMREELRQNKVRKIDPAFLKKNVVKRANLEVARIMNHTKQAPKGWPRTKERYEMRIKKAEERIAKANSRLADKRARLRKRKQAEKKKRATKQAIVSKQKDSVEKHKSSVNSWREKRDNAKDAWDKSRLQKRQVRSSRRRGKRTKKARLDEAQEKIDRFRVRLDKAEEGLSCARERYRKSMTALEKKQSSLSQFKKKSNERISRAEKSVERAKLSLKKAELAKQKIKVDYALAKDCRTWNLGTSLKSYVHPKIIYKWCRRVEYDWRKVYSKTLQRKFAWVEQ